MGFTIIQKILSKYAGKDLIPGDIITIEPSMVMSHDNSSFIISNFHEMGYEKVWDKNKIAIIFDHCVPAKTPEHKKNHDVVRDFVNLQSIPHFYDDSAGVSHQVMMEKGLVLPGQIVIGADSHSTIYGALNSAGIPINRTEMAGIWATGTIWLKVPESFKIVLNGSLPKGVYAKDIILNLLGILKADGATYTSLEFHGSALPYLSMSERMTMCNMAVELGAKVGIMPYDEVTKSYLEKIGKKNYTSISADFDAHYQKVITLNLDDLEPQIACPHTVDNIKPLHEVNDVRINQGYLGSCTNGRLEDLQIAASILKGKKIASSVKLLVYPASTQVKELAREKGILAILEKAGAIIETASCGPCFGAVGATLKDNEVCISSSNRNFCGRMGSPKSFVYLGSPAVVAASCITGKITDPRVML